MRLRLLLLLFDRLGYLLLCHFVIPTKKSAADLETRRIDVCDEFVQLLPASLSCVLLQTPGPAAPPFHPPATSPSLQEKPEATRAYERAYLCGHTIFPNSLIIPFFLLARAGFLEYNDISIVH